MAKKKKPAANPARGFATTSLPSKAKAVEPPPPEPAPEEPPPPAEQAKDAGSGEQKPGHYMPPTAEEEEEAELQKLVETQGPKVRRETQRLVNKTETEKRTLRSSCHPLRLGKFLAFQHARSTRQTDEEDDDADLLGEEILKLARDEFAQQAERSRRVAGNVLLPTWTLHRVFLALGFPEERVEEGLKAIMGIAGNEEKPAEVLVDDLLEWMAIHSNVYELPNFSETTTVSGSAVKKPTPADAESPPESSGGSTPVAPPAKTADARHRAREKANGSPKAPMTPRIDPTPSAHARLASEISNLELSSPKTAPPVKKFPAKQSFFSPSKQGDSKESDSSSSSDSSESEEEEEETPEPEPEPEEDLEDTPENLIPRYVQMRTKLYRIHPSLSPAVSIKKGKSKSTAKIDRMPAGLSPDTVKQVKKMQDAIIAIERDPLFDLRTADAYWMEARLKMDAEANAERRARSKPRLPARNAPLKPRPAPPARTRPVASPSPPDNAADEVMKEAEEAARALGIGEGEEDEDGMPLIGSLFEGPPTEEATAEGVNIAVRDFEESAGTSGTLGGKAGKSKGRAGVGAAAMRKVVEEVCKSRDNSSKARFEVIPGTSLSNRCKLAISWSQPSPVSATSPVAPFEVAILTPNPTTTVFEMRSLAAATKDQAEGFIATYGLFKLYGKKDEKLYLRLPTIWRNVWAELVELDRQDSEAQERQVLAKLKKVVETPEANGIPKSQVDDANGEEKLPVGQTADAPADSTEERKQQPAYLRYLQGEEIMEDWQRRRERPSYLHMEEYRKNLPMWSFKQQILGALDASNIIVLCGETGCGKSTQLPAFLLENELSNGRPCKIYCTEPRRISALSLAKRVSEELGERKGEVGGKSSLVGYAIRLESASHEGTRLIYATTGIVMRMLERQPDLEEVTHLVLDEVHERSIESDFLLVVLKRLLKKRKDLKVVLMSATVDAERFSNYLGGAPVLNVPGRTFPVTSYFLEDAIEVTGFKAEDDPRKSRGRNQWDDNDAELDTSGGDGSITDGSLQSYSPDTKTALSRMNHYEIQYDLIIRLLETVALSPKYTAFSHAILIFLPGLNEIRRLNDMILGHPVFGPQRGGRLRDSGGWLVYPLHSTIASEDQEEAFNIPPPGMRKIVLATNIAETGITIPDVTAVIDTGKHKEMRFDEKRQLSRLVETFIARANAKQRRGRAGRVQEGICFHMFTRARFSAAMAEQQTPEIMRLSLQDLVLRVKICGLGNVEEVLTSALDAPTPKNIRRAVDSLVEVKALTPTPYEELTPLGRQLAKLPLDVYLGKLVLLGCIYGCLDAAVTIAAILSSKNPFVAPMGYRSEADRAKLSFKRGNSDLLTGWNAYSSWRRVCSTKGGNISEADFCRKNYLSARTLSNIEDLKGQLIAAVLDAGFISLAPAERAALNRSRYTTYRRNNFFVPPESVNHASENDAVVNAVIAAGFYPKLLVRDGKGWRNVGNGKIVQVHMGSVNKTTDSNWLAYYGIMQANNKYYDAHETSHVDELALALLCGDVEFKMYSGVAIVDGNRIRFSFADWRGMAAVKILRARLRDVVTRTYRNPGRELSEAQRRWRDIGFRVFGKLREEMERKKRAGQ